jgi:hypothetical protein
MENEKIDEIVSELLNVLDYAEEIIEIVGRIQRQYNAGEDPELDSEIFYALLSDIKAMEECVVKAEKLYRETQRAKK